MTCIGIITAGLENESLLASFKECVSILQNNNVNVLCEESTIRYADGLSVFDNSSNRPEFLLTIGGDGTLLHGIQYAIKYNAPILGINRGSLGFLTETVPSMIKQAISSILEGRYQLETRSLMRVQDSQKDWYAFNDAVITRGGYSRLIRVRVYCNDSLMESFTADGIIVSTPTGSTGYSFSAGGPIIYPSVNCMLITPICAHTLQHFSCIVPSTSKIKIELYDDNSQSAQLQTDGQTRKNLTNGSIVHISLSDINVSLIRLKPFDYFQLIRNKLSEIPNH